MDPMQIRRKIGERIRKSRKDVGLTQKEVADELGIHVITLSRYENAKNDVDVVSVYQIAEVLGEEPIYLLTGNRFNAEHYIPANLKDSVTIEEKGEGYTIDISAEVPVTVRFH
jgi:transcriptional regulator with XRE-family HTH domain